MKTVEFMAYYLAIDLGTTGCRSILFDERLNAIGSAYEEYGLITPKETWVEQDARLWWEMTLRTAKLAIANSGIDAKDILGISVSSQGITLVPVDREFTPLCNALSWLDVRAETQTEKIRSDYSEKEFFNITGKKILSSYTLPKLLWLKENMPDVFEKAWKFLMPMDFLIAKLTGNAYTDHSMASGTLAYDLKNGCWKEDILSRYGIPQEKLPQIVWSGTNAGYVRKEVAQSLGLSECCLVAVGAQDQKCAALGVGLSADKITVSLGTAGAITKLWKSVETEKSDRVSWCGYTEPSTWVTEGVINTAGTCLRYVRDLFFQGEDYQTVNKEAAACLQQGCNLLFYPYLSGPSSPDYYPDSQGCFYGITLATKRGDYAASVMEGIAFQIRILLEAMDAYGNVRELILFGGGAKSDLWCQVIADITDLTVVVPSTAEAASAGAAILAARACGKELGSLPCAKSYPPSGKRVYYQEKYQKYRKTEKKLWQ